MTEARPLSASALGTGECISASWTLFIRSDLENRLSKGLAERIGPEVKRRMMPRIGRATPQRSLGCDQANGGWIKVQATSSLFNR